MLYRSQTLSVSIDRHPDEVYGFVSNPENLPQWATTFVQSIRRSDSGWTAETPQGPVRFSFAERNEFRVADQYVSPAPGVEVYVPMRVLPNGSGSEIVFTIFQTPGMTDEGFVSDIGLVEGDLRTLKELLDK